MVTPEEARVLAFLKRRKNAPAAEVARSCLAGASGEWVGQILSQLDWLGYVTVFYGQAGEPRSVQITDRGRRLTFY